MCWITYKGAKCKTAEKDIRIFKVCSPSNSPEVLISAYREFEYTLNKIYSAEEELILTMYGKDTNYGKINKGFHSYSPNCSIKNETIISIWYDRQFLGSYDSDSIIVYGYIPKGAHYYLNEEGEYVSDKICLTNIEQL